MAGDADKSNMRTLLIALTAVIAYCPPAWSWPYDLIHVEPTDQYGRILPTDGAPDPTESEYNRPDPLYKPPSDCFSPLGDGKWARVIVISGSGRMCEALASRSVKRYLGARVGGCRTRRRHIYCSLRGARSVLNVIDKQRYETLTRHIGSPRAFYCGVYKIGDTRYTYFTRSIEMCFSSVIGVAAQRIAYGGCGSGQIMVCGDQSDWAIFTSNSDDDGADFWSVAFYHPSSGYLFTRQSDSVLPR